MITIYSTDCQIDVKNVINKIDSKRLIKTLESRGFEITDKKSKEEREDIEDDKIRTTYLDTKGDVDIWLSDIIDELDSSSSLLDSIDDEDIIEYLDNKGYSLLETRKNPIQSIDSLYDVVDLKRYHTKERLLEEINELLKFDY